MTATPVVLPDTPVAALGEHFDAEAMVELTTRENFRSRFNHALDIAAAGFSEGHVVRAGPHLRTDRFRLGQRGDQQSPEPDRLRGQVVRLTASASDR